jgi:hypothetical protein
MTEEGGSGTRLVCPACGRAREAGGRFCPGCGLDYWRLAAGSTVESAGGPVRKGRFGRGKRPAFAPAPVASASASPSGTAGVASAAGAGAPAGAAASTGEAGSATLQDRVRRAAASIRIPQSPRSRWLVGGLATAIGLLIVVALVMRPAGPGATGPTAKPSPSAPAADDVIAAFFTSVRDPAAAFEVKAKGTFTQIARGKRVGGSMTADMRVVGDSLSGTLRLRQPGIASFNGSIVRIAELTWTRAPGAAWHRQGLPATADSVNPFAWIATVDDLTYVRAGQRQAGERTHILESTKWLSGTQYDGVVVQLSDAQRDSRMEVETTDAGVPLRATYQFTIRGTLSAGAGSLELRGSSEFTFSHWDEAFTIGPPA